MSQLQDARAERIARYKEERRRQLNESTSRLVGKDGSSSSSSDGPRMTRTSRLRAAATAASDSSSNSKEPLRSPSSNQCDSLRCKVDKDKSSKRKSNLNRSLTSEEVSSLNDDLKNRRRRRRFFPSDVLQQSLNPSSNEDKVKSDTSLTASNMSPLSSPITASATVKTSIHKRSELSIHMENARKSVTSSVSDLGKCNKAAARRSVTSSPKEKSPRPLSNINSNLEKELNGNIKQSNKENIKRKTDETNYIKNTLSNRKDKTIVPNSANIDVDRSKNLRISKRMDELTALTRETLARVERLASKTRESPRREIDSTRKANSSTNHLNSQRASPGCTTKTTETNKNLNNKKKVLEISEITITAGPISILKRKISQEESKSVVTTHTPPVTFSPNVVEPSITNRKAGILKKRRSLDESQVLRHRSCSPDVANNRSILKTQRRSSLEEISRHTGDSNLQGILKRKTLRNDDDDNSLNSPQGILKRKSGASSAGSSTSTHHVSIATAVILAAAEGAEIVLDPNDTDEKAVKPILKKKSNSEDVTYVESSGDLKPILKKKSSTETDDSEDKPKRPILKSSRSVQETKELNDSFKYGYESGSECDVRPILKTSRDDQPRPRLSFCADEEIATADLTRRRSFRRTQPLPDIQSNASVKLRENDRDLTKPRVVSVSELVMNFEKSTGAIPKKSSFKRNSDRYKTQPITFNELEASLNFVHNPICEDFSRLTISPIVNAHNIQSLLNLSISLENDANVNSFLSNSIQNTSFESGEGKMSSDSAFQSLGDGLELEQDEKSNQQCSNSGTPSIDDKLQMKALAIEAKNLKLAKANSDIEKYRNREISNSASRSPTLSVHSDKVQEAATSTSANKDYDEVDPLNLTLSERIKLFNSKPVDTRTPNRLEVPKRRARFSTQPITFEEVETARYLSPQNSSEAFALDDDDLQHHRAITNAKIDIPASPSHKLAMKTKEVNKQSRSRNDIPDEGISSNDSDTDSDLKIIVSGDSTPSSKTNRNRPGKCYSDHTSDDSSGGREIQSIIGREAVEKRKQLRERSHHANICKSKSQAALGDESSDNFSDGIQKSMTTAAMRRTIGELQAKLQQSGDNDWKKRIPKYNVNEELNLLNVKNLYNDELSEKSILKAKKDELDASSKLWKNRVEKSDAFNFSVAGKMQIKDLSSSPLSIPSSDKVRRTPKAKRFKGKEDDDSRESSSTPESPDLEKHHFTRSCSDPVKPEYASELDNSTKISERKVIVSRPDDEETFKSFFKSVEILKNEESIDISLEDFDSITREADSLLVRKRTVKVQRRQGTSRNPLKILAARTDIKNEYTENFTGVAERETKRLNIEKIAKNNTNLAVEAIAGLTSKEDFAAVSLKKASNVKPSYAPFKDLMLLHIKGRRFVQTRLVEPVISSINQGDNYILVTPNELYNYVGAFSNVIEQTRAAEVFNHIQQTSDLGCKAKKAVTIDGSQKGKDFEKFCSYLQGDDNSEITNIKNVEEDEIYESDIISTNMIYCFEHGELVPFEKYWGHLPKYEILETRKTYVFDFGSEMYVWSGKTADVEEKRAALKLAKELWDHGYDYTECSTCPLNVAQTLGDREKANISHKSVSRPDWALFAKITQHRETVLFKEKFLDWPDFSRVIRCKDITKSKGEDSSIVVQAIDGEILRKSNCGAPDFNIHGTHLGRGKHYFDEETNRNFEITTLDITCWTKCDNTYDKLDDNIKHHFYDGESYIIRWNYRVTVTGRELSGKPSKHLQLGRDRCVYFCWNGKNASVNDKGFAAFLTVELDSENAPQQIITEGSEPPAFLQLFDGKMFIHSGKRDSEKEKNRLYICRGEIDSETVLNEVPCSMKSLRSRSCFILVMSDKVVLWKGAKSTEQSERVSVAFAKYICSEKPECFNFELEDSKEIPFEQCIEGDETDEFLSILSNKRQLYNSLLDSSNSYDSTPRIFYFSSTSGKFKAEELFCPYRNEHVTPYPFLQSDLYSASQPALFLIDNIHELWLWQGWWPEHETDNELLEQTGRGTLRWHDEKKAAMQTAISYWRQENTTSDSVPCYLVWAGLEPITFTNLFPYWSDHEDVAQINIQEGYSAGEFVMIEKELSLLSRDTYPLAELLQRPLPDGVDPRQLEKYLTPEDFFEILSMTKEEFHKLTPWKQTQLKKEKGLF